MRALLVVIVGLAACRAESTQSVPAEHGNAAAISAVPSLPLALTQHYPNLYHHDFSGNRDALKSAARNLDADLANAELEGSAVVITGDSDLVSSILADSLDGLPVHRLSRATLVTTKAAATADLERRIIALGGKLEQLPEPSPMETPR